jgi:hypothetical protein
MIAALVAALAVAAVAAGLLVATRMRRLHRLHQRVDAARAGLDLALHRRALLADRAGIGTVRTHGREAAANALGVALAALDRAGLDPGLRADLDEAEVLLVLARHVHNEAVRDTLALRSRLLVRLLRLAGTAPMPQYFETVDPPGVTRAAAAGPAA